MSQLYIKSSKYYPRWLKDGSKSCDLPQNVLQRLSAAQQARLVDKQLQVNQKHNRLGLELAIPDVAVFIANSFK